MLRQRLNERYVQRRDREGAFRARPLWTYFELAEAHQWLYLNEPAQVWTTLDWFFRNQSFPGLYTWWEGATENSASLFEWEKIRGWANPQGVTPHYWTAAEMLSLQLDMLVYVQPSASGRTLVLGSGVPAPWLNSTIAVGPVYTELGPISWCWSKRVLHVKGAPDATPVELGRAFPQAPKVLRLDDRQALPASC